MAFFNPGHSDYLKINLSGRQDNNYRDFMSSPDDLINSNAKSIPIDGVK
jgi:hypothetical protein